MSKIVVGSPSLLSKQIRPCKLVELCQYNQHLKKLEWHASRKDIQHIYRKIHQYDIREVDTYTGKFISMISEKLTGVNIYIYIYIERERERKLKQ
jgi:hypothetical protein